MWCWQSISCFRLLASLPYMSICTRYIILLKSGSPFHKRKLPLNYFFKIYFILVIVISRLFQKWCSSGVVSTSLSRTIIDFIGFSGILQDTAVAGKKYLNHIFYILSLAGFLMETCKLLTPIFLNNSLIKSRAYLHFSLL